jgi:hypothetical protein
MKMFVVAMLTVFSASGAFAKTNSFTCASEDGHRAILEVKYPLIGTPSVTFKEPGTETEYKKAIEDLENTTTPGLMLLSEFGTIVIISFRTNISIPQAILEKNPASEGQVGYYYQTNSLMNDSTPIRIQYNCTLD